MHENGPSLSLTEIENLVTATENDASTEEQLSVENLIGSPLVDFTVESEIYPEAASSCGDLDNILNYEQNSLSSSFPHYSTPSFYEPLSTPQSLQYSTPMSVEQPLHYSSPLPQFLDYSSTPQPLLPPLPPQPSMAMQPYVGDERIMRIANELMAGLQYPNLPAYDLHNSAFQQQTALQCSLAGGFDHAQLLMDTQVQKQQNNSSLVAVCSGSSSSSSAPPRLHDISPLEESTFKIGSITPEEKREKIHRFMKKRNERNFTKKIKYACRKTLADSRPRVRGRFAKNEEIEESTGVHTGSHGYEERYEQHWLCRTALRRNLNISFPFLRPSGTLPCTSPARNNAAGERKTSSDPPTPASRSAHLLPLSPVILHPSLYVAGEKQRSRREKNQFRPPSPASRSADLLPLSPEVFDCSFNILLMDSPNVEQTLPILDHKLDNERIAEGWGIHYNGRYQARQPVVGPTNLIKLDDMGLKD